MPFRPLRDPSTGGGCRAWSNDMELGGDRPASHRVAATRARARDRNIQTAAARVVLVAIFLAVGACTNGSALRPTPSAAPSSRSGDSSGQTPFATPPPSFGFLPGAPAGPTGPTEDATLVRVVDGDTIRAIVGGKEYRIRFIGMNTPELNEASAATPEPFAELATQANARLLAGGRLVLERDVSETDRYGRLLRDIWVEAGGQWTLVNLALVDEGYAQVATYPPDVKYVDALLAAGRAARAAGRGLWGSAP